MKHLRETDPEIYEAVVQETRRQYDNIELIASENFTSRAVLEAAGSTLTNPRLPQSRSRHRPVRLPGQ